MLPRIWVVLLALLLLAAPARGALAEIADAQPSISLCDDDALEPVQVLPAQRAPDRAAGAARPRDAVLPAPALARVFRPPRRSFD